MQDCLSCSNEISPVLLASACKQTLPCFMGLMDSLAGYRDKVVVHGWFKQA